MALTNPGTPVWPDGGNFRFEGVVYPELDEANRAWQIAMENWHNAVGGNPGLGIPRNEALATIHDDVKRRTNNPALREPRTPFWNAQMTVVGGAGFESDPALVEELKRAYATHAGPETEALVRASQTLHEHQANLSRAQARVLRRVATLPGMDAGVFGTLDDPNSLRTMLVQQVEERGVHSEAARVHSERYIREFPTLRGGHTPPPVPVPREHAPPAEPARRRSGRGRRHRHGAHAEPGLSSAERAGAEEASTWVGRAWASPEGRWGFIGAGVVAVIGGYYWLKQKNQKKDDPQHPSIGH